MKVILSAASFLLFATAATAQEPDALARAIELGKCPETGVKSATYLTSGALQITCKRKSLFRSKPKDQVAPVGAEATNIGPFVGSLGPGVFGAGAAGAGVLAIAGGNSSSSDTQ